MLHSIRRVKARIKIWLDLSFYCFKGLAVRLYLNRRFKFEWKQTRLCSWFDDPSKACPLPQQFPSKGNCHDQTISVAFTVKPIFTRKSIWLIAFVLAIFSLMLPPIQSLSFNWATASGATPHSQHHSSAAPDSEKIQHHSTTHGYGDIPSADHYCDIPYFSERDGMHSALILNNNMSYFMVVKVTIFNSRGAPLVLPPVSLPPQMPKSFSLSKLTENARGDFKSGNIQIFYHGPTLAVTCEVIAISEKHRISFESMEIYSSTRLDSIVWLPDADTRGQIALTNTEPYAITVTQTLNDRRSDARHSTLVLNSRETRVIDVRELIDERRDDPLAALLSLEHNGAPGALIATGFIFNPKNGFSSNLRFVDRSAAKSNQLSGVGLRFGPASEDEGVPSGTSFRAPLLIANASNTQTDAHIFVNYTIGANAGRVNLGQVSLAAGEVKQIELARELARRGVVGPVKDSGIDISYSGAKGSVIARLTSVDASGDYSFDVPIKDPLAGAFRVGGNNLWRLDDGYRTVLQLKNFTDKVAYAIVQVRYEGGNYNPDKIKLEPFQSVALDIGQLRDGQKKDIQGGVMPKEATEGQVIWFEDKMGTLIGRTEVFNIESGIAISCGCSCACPCPPSFDSAEMNPSSVVLAVGESQTFVPREWREDCFGNLYPCSITSEIEWFSSDTSVATVDSGGSVSVVGVGSASIVAQFYSTVYGYGCQPITVHPGTSGTVTAVRVQVGNVVRGGTLPYSIPPTVEASVYVTITPSLPAGHNVQLDVINGSSNNGIASISGNATLTSSGFTTVIGGTQPSPGYAGNLKIRARLDGRDVAFSAGFSVCAHPINFRQDGPGVDIGGGTLRFTYRWDSDGGLIDQLDQVTIGEIVSYDQANCTNCTYYPPNPPFQYAHVQPSELTYSANGGLGVDTHSNGSITAGPAASYTATQYYRYWCSRCSSQPQILMGPLTIRREVLFSNGSWFYIITKSGYNAVRPVP